MRGVRALVPVVSLTVAIGCGSQAPDLSRLPRTDTPYFYYSTNYPLTGEQAKALPKGSVVGLEYNLDDLRERLAAYQDAGVRTHVYFEGPGGATGNGEALEPDECQRIKANAGEAKVAGVTDLAKNDCHLKGDWQGSWRSVGFLKYLELKLTELAPFSLYSVEVDNLHNGGFGSGKLIDFVERFAQLREKAGAPQVRILLKNPTLADLDAIEARTDLRPLMADFAIVEEFHQADWCKLREGLGSRTPPISLALGWNTHKYHAEAGADGVDHVLGGSKQSDRKARWTCK